MENKLYRSRTDSTIAGVCGGLGEYFRIDPTFIRILAVLLVFADGVGLLAYIIAWIIIPQVPVESAAEIQSESKETPVPKPPKTEYIGWNKYVPGAILIAIGVFFILRNNFWWWDFEQFWPALLILVGIFLIFRWGNRRRREEAENQELKGGPHDSSQV
ncbi:MAG: PspC domain-containing protein [candidate division Zixibacteria bacterium]